MAGFVGTFVVSWSQTEIDGLAGAPISALDVGVTWRWQGSPVRVDGPNDVLVLNGPEGEAEMRKRAARTVRRLVGPALALQHSHDVDRDEPIFDRFFVVTDGRDSYPITLIDLAETARPLLLFLGRMPPSNCDLWVTQCLENSDGVNRSTNQPTGVICFTEGTLLRTPKGNRAVETLIPGDMIDTRDGGVQPVQWVGHRQLSGARMFALPELRPIRIRTGALGLNRPSPDLIVSPRHRILVRGDMAQALFNTAEVLVTAADMVNDRTIAQVHGVRRVTYYHIMLAAHHVVWANGVATESFHPGHTSLETIPGDQRDGLFAADPRLRDDPQAFGDPARRMLTTSEAAILMHEARGRSRQLHRTIGG